MPEVNPEVKSESPRTSWAPEVVKAFAWPLTLVLFAISFWSPLHKLAAAIPDALANSETVTVGSISLRVGKNLSEGANQEVREALSGMTANDVTLVVENPLPGPHTYIGFSPEFVQWRRLERLGMVATMSDQELTDIAKHANNPKGNFGVKPTARYDKVRKFLLDVLVEVVSGGVRDAQPARSGD